MRTRIDVSMPDCWVCTFPWSSGVFLIITWYISAIPRPRFHAPKGLEAARMEQWESSTARQGLETDSVCLLTVIH